MRKAAGVTLALAALALSSPAAKKPEPAQWKLTAESRDLVKDEKLAGQIFRALDAAAGAGTDPSISHFNVRAATAVEVGGQEHVVLGGNSEYRVPEAIHGETSLLNHATVLLGPATTWEKVQFIAFYSERCGDSLGCGDCRDYEMATTDYENLLIVCGQASDHTVRVRRFMQGHVPEEVFPEVTAEKIPLSTGLLKELVQAAEEARRNGVTLFTGERHTGAAGLSYRGNIYRSAGSDDAAFHYRYPIGGLLQQAAAEGDYLLRAIVVAGEKGEWPRVNYRDRQYGFESSSFNRLSGKEPALLILTDGAGRFRLTTFEAALPHPFSAARFMPEAIGDFLKSHGVE